MSELIWEEFEPSVFETAQRVDQPVLLLLTQAWCPHCRDLETVFRDEAVVQMCREKFVTTRVDAERRPDVNERYGTGGWPTVAYLTPKGDLIGHHGYLDAPELIARLTRITRLFAEQRGKLEDGIRDLWATEEILAAQRLSGTGVLDSEIVDGIVQAIYEKFDARHGGWGEGANFPHPEAIDFALVQVAKKNDQNMREVVERTLTRMAHGGLHDPIDGGFFRYSATADWRSPHHEKLLDVNAMQLRAYLEGAQLLGNPEYFEVARGIVRWMLGFMLDEDTGAFFGNQDADADYYVLDETERRRREPPRLDRTIYTNSNAIAVSSLLKASVVLDDRGLRERAMVALQFLLDHVVDRRQGVFHYWDGTFHLAGMLADQAYLIRALIDASQHTGDADLLLPAERIAEQAIERQRAPNGGFYDILHDQRQSGTMQRRNRSILENSVMAEALLRLSYLSRRDEFRQEAIATLQAFVDDYKRYGYYVAGYGRAVDLIFYEPLSITIVGDRDSAGADALRRAALSPYVPSRVVQMLDPKHDPVLLGRSGYQPEDAPVAHLALGTETRARCRTPAELLDAIAAIEKSRR